MAQIILAAFVMGLLGSFHCVGMCGPIALSLPLKNDNDLEKFSGALFYNLGRIITYTFFGFLFGVIGKSIALFGYQQWLSITSGLLIITFTIVPQKIAAFKTQNFILQFFGQLRSSMEELFLKKNFSSLFSIGLLNGLLPCGLIYMAAAVAVATGDVIKSMAFMAIFGLGTLPMMWSIAFFGNYVSIKLRQKIRKAYPYMMLLMAFLLILREMGLGIPYVSPKMNIEKNQTQYRVGFMIQFRKIYLNKFGFGSKILKLSDSYELKSNKKVSRHYQRFFQKKILIGLPVFNKLAIQKNKRKNTNLQKKFVCCICFRVVIYHSISLL